MQADTSIPQDLDCCGPNSNHICGHFGRFLGIEGQFIIILTQRFQFPEQAFNRSILNNYSENRCQHIPAKMDYEFESQLCIPMLAASHRISQKTNQNKNICRLDENMYAVW